MITKVTDWRRLALASGGLALLALPFQAGAQAQEEDEDQFGTIEEIIVTGTAGGAEIRKFDASFAITTMSDSDINEYAPQSTADLLKLVPGVWSESSGGVSGANVFVRGFPGGGDAPFYTLQVNGAPIFPPPTLSFLENTTLFRVDETILRVEALRGGPNPVFSNGQPGLTTNMILREGGEETEGMVKYTTSDYDLRRFDAYLSGELSEGFYYMVGGYLLSSPGIRDAGFNAREGNQVTINLTKDLDNGSINVFYRQTDDHGQWYLPSPLNVPGVDAEYSQIGTLNRQRQITFGPDNEQQTIDLGEGRGWDGAMTGGSIVLDITDDWELTDRFSYTSGAADTLGLVPDGGAVNVGDLLADPSIDTLAVVTGPLSGAVTGRAITSSDYIQRWGAWEVRKDIEAFTNDLSIARGWDRGTATFGFYAANASADEWWSLGNHKYEVVQHGGEVVTGIECNDDPDSSSCNWNYDIDATGDATTTAFYAATTFDFSDALTFDVGVRAENHQVNYSVDEGLDGQVTLAIDYDESEVSWTAAANYLINDTMGVFGRINSGSKMPYFDDFRDNRGAYAGGNLLIQEVDQFEFGFKWVTDAMSVYATAFFTEVDPTFFTALTGQQAIIQTQESTGVEVDALWANDAGFSISLNATIQDSEIKSGPNDGNETQRQPGWQLRLTPRYEFEAGNMTGTVYGTLSAIDDRWSEPENVNILEGYEKLDLGVILRINEQFVVQLSADNVTDEDALTEGDPRNITAPNGRFIMPRTLEFSVGYEF
ncbi:MAG: TonB-dependent receptor [Gammaproteobacteria bacterium]|nr:TonB-dependent receptor [Gammaproteobacteria bacterium]MDH4255004.1 TonB-dependent receptor [Gammaproteobacteria bacterium]MDH5311008.1 TonB-dependent receptor [Gammaproteobacteria bacterium]